MSGRAQLVAHPRQELGLGAVRGLERRARLALGAREVQLGDVAQDDRHEHAAIGVELGERRLERELLAVGALADQLVQRAGRLAGARADQESPGRRIGATLGAIRDETIDRPADRLGRGDAEQGLGGAVEEDDAAVAVDRDDAVGDGVDELGDAKLALAQRGLHRQPLADVEEGRDRAVDPARLHAPDATSTRPGTTFRRGAGRLSSATCTSCCSLLARRIVSAADVPPGRATAGPARGSRAPSSSPSSP